MADIEQVVRDLVSMLVQDNPDLDSDSLDEWIREEHSSSWIREAMADGEDAYDLYDEMASELNLAVVDGVVKGHGLRSARIAGEAS